MLQTRARFRLRTFLILLLLAGLVPALVAAGAGLLQAAQAYRESSQERLVQTAGTLARATENEIDAHGAILGAFASDPNQSASAGSSWRDRATKALGGIVVDLGNAQVAPEIRALAADFAKADAVQDAAGTVRGTTPPGPLVPASGPALRDRQRPRVSNLYFEPEGNKPVIAIAIHPRPMADIAGSGRAAGADTSDVVAIELPAQHMLRRLDNVSGRNQSHLVAVVDGTGRVIARSRDAERWIGRPVPDWKRLQAMGTQRGFFTATTLEGAGIAFAFDKLANTPGWVLVIGEPMKAFNARWQLPLVGLGVGSVMALILGITTAIWLSRKMLETIRSLVKHADAVMLTVEEGAQVSEPPPVPPSAVQEFDSLRLSIQNADEALRARAEEQRRAANALRESELRYRTLVQSGAMVYWRIKPGGEVIEADGLSALIGADEGVPIGNWIGYLHEDDRSALSRLIPSHPGEPAPELARRLDSIDRECRIRSRDATWRWVRVRGAPIVDERGRLSEWVGVLEDVDARRRAQERITYMAMHDSLTGLPNRAMLSDKVELAIRLNRERGEEARGRTNEEATLDRFAEPMSCLLCIDLNRFKEINDSLGHAVGDDLLCHVARRLKLLVDEEEDVVARLDGVEFALLKRQIDGMDGANAFARRVLGALSREYQVGMHHLNIGATIGVLLLDRSVSHADAALRNADVALYHAKQQGRGRYLVFEAGMDQKIQSRHELETDLRRALKNNELSLHYQPLIDVATRNVGGVEALIRWHSPTRGFVPPDEFIGLAEDVGLIIPLGAWVLNRACQDAMRWPEDPRVIAVNISARQLSDRSLVETVRNALRSSGLAPHRLELEVSERAFLAEGASEIEVLHQLKSLGVQIALDDFGTGQTSLGSLSSAPFDKIKIDRTFTRNIGERHDASPIIRAITGLCQGLGIATVAEGVETEQQFEFLSGVGCTQAQGWLFSKAVPPDQLPAVMARLGTPVSA